MLANSRGLACRQAAMLRTHALSCVLAAVKRAAVGWCHASCMPLQQVCLPARCRPAAEVSTSKKAAPVRAPGAQQDMTCTQRPMTRHWTTKRARGASTPAALSTAASELPCWLVQECKALNGRLLDFLKQASVVQQLVTYLVIPVQSGGLWPLGRFH